jgi:hypothetical protein
MAVDQLSRGRTIGESHKAAGPSTPGSRDFAPFVHRWDASPDGRLDNRLTLYGEARGGQDEEAIDVFLRHGLKDGRVARRAGHIGQVELDLGRLRDSADLCELPARRGLSIAIFRALGMTSKSSSSRSRLASSSEASMYTPVTLAPGRAKLARIPDSTRPSPPQNALTMGIVLVAWLAGRIAS